MRTFERPGQVRFLPSQVEEPDDDEGVDDLAGISLDVNNGGIGDVWQRRDDDDDLYDEEEDENDALVAMAEDLGDWEASRYHDLLSST